MKKTSTSLRSLAAILAAAGILQACVPLVAAGVGTGVVATLDRRTYGTQIEDREIEIRFNRAYPAKLEERTSASATVFNGVMLLTGQAIDAEARAAVEQHARATRGMKDVVNEITLGYPASFTSRSNDALLSSKVKARLFNAKEISGHHIKVTTESGVVYLLGVVTEAEAAVAVEIARTTSGVQKVVRVFEIVSPEEARRMSIQSSSGTAPAKAP